jgi:ATP-dependent DNA helicase RecG
MVLAFQRALDCVRDRQDITQVALPTGQMLSIEDCPELAVREALANAVVHRDYRAVGPIVIEHSPSLLLVLSPGPLVTGVTPANILTPPSLPRNPALAQAFRLLGFAEEVGRGVDRMVREMIRSGRSTPHIENTPDHVRVSLPGGPPNTSIARFVAQLPKQERDDTDAMLVLHTLCANRTVSASSMAPIIQKVPEETEAVLRRLAHDEVAMIEPTRQSAPRRRKTYRLRAEVLKALGPAIPYQRRVVDDIDRKIIAHVHEYGRITNRTVQNLFDVDVQRAKSILLHLIARELLVKTTARRGGPGIEYGLGPRFPAAKPRQTSP